ncbi:hypothetical protein [Herbidospora cretacea]|uniref:hypothetical protein n=1 Tax=Herbidospora cretacea TaxID=28444 RepID=UPI00077434B6|nr:hypothetical protein [Herbidospora cretacea]
MNDEQLDALLVAAEADLLAYLREPEDLGAFYDALLRCQPRPAPGELLMRIDLQELIWAASESFGEGIAACLTTTWVTCFEGVDRRIRLFMATHDLGWEEGYGHNSSMRLNLHVALSHLLILTRAAQGSAPFSRRLFAEEQLDHVMGRLQAVQAEAARYRLSVTGRDLSELAISARHIDALLGVEWDDATIWPSEVADLIRADSIEIAPGRYQIQAGYTRDHVPV